MNRSERPVGEDDLQAFFDGRLSQDRREAVERYLVERPDVAADLQRDRENLESLRSRLAFKAVEPIPSRLRIASVREARRQRHRERLASVAAVCAWLVVGAGIGWSASQYIGQDPGLGGRAQRVADLADDAISAHRTFVVEVAHPVEVGAGEEAHLVQWLSRRLGTELEAPDLTSLGLRLMGGRLLPAGTGPAAMLMYDDDAGTRLTLYIKADEAAQTAFEFAEEDSYSAFYWRDGGLGYAITGDIGRDTLLEVAQAVYHQLDPAPLHKDLPPVSDQAL